MAQYTDKDDVEEEWRDIDIYPQYQISNIGNVVRKKDGLLLKQYPQKSGYVYVVLDRGEGRHYVPIHRLVCIAFHGMDGYVKGLYVDHINTIRSDNRACNLRWVTAKENANNETTKLNRKRKRKVMKHYIDKDALAAEIERHLKYANNGILYAQNGVEKGLNEYEVDLNAWEHCQSMCKNILSFLDTLEVKEVDLEKELDRIWFDNKFGDMFDNSAVDFANVREICRHFFELGLSINNPITAADRGIAEEIIINLKRVEQDYRIDLTKEIEWLRNQVKKGK